MISLIVLLAVAVFFTGIISKVKAKIAARKMPSVFQPLFDVLRLFKKGGVYGSATSVIFRLAPIVYFSTVLLAVFFIPVGPLKALISFEGDFVLFAYLLALGKFFMIIAAMDTGSGFEGMGANREALYSMLVEPAFFILLGSLALFTNHISFIDLFTHLHMDSNLSLVIGVAAIYVLVFVAMAENSRMPVDDPKTHLELTMIHEVMVLDNSGFDLALIQIASWLKFVLYGTLISNYVLDISWPWYVQIPVFTGIQGLFAVTVGLLEAFRARNKMSKNPQWILMLSSIAIVVFLTTLIISEKLILR